jgi:serine/threonine-protein kinase
LAPRIYQFGQFRLDERTRLLRRDGDTLSITPKIFDTLLFLVSNAGRTVSREELILAVWPDTFVEEGNLNYNMSQLRKVLGEHSSGAPYVQTIPKVGYRFIGEVTHQGDDQIQESAATQAPSADREAEPERSQVDHSSVKPTRLWVMSAAIVILTVTAAGTSWKLWRTTRQVPRPLIRLSVDLGPDALVSRARAGGLDFPVPEVVISPDGTRIVFHAHGPHGAVQLATRLLENAQTTVLPGTENAIDPFFSPDGRWVGFFADGQLKKVLSQGDSVPVMLCAAPRPNGGTWLEDGTIVASLNVTSGLARIPGGGGTPQPLTKTGIGEAVHQWPQVLPGNKVVLFTTLRGFSDSEYARINALFLSNGERKTVLTGAYFGRYVPSGHLLYMRKGVLFGVGFDLSRLEIRGTPTPLFDDVVDEGRKHARFDFSPAPSGSGMFVYLPAANSNQPVPIVWLDREGNTKPLMATPGRYGLFRLSPDGRRLALTEDNSDIFVYDLQRETKTRITFSGHEISPVWAPDGKHIVFQSRPANRFNISWINADGAAEAQVILEGINPILPYSFSPDGKRLLYQEITANGGQDLRTLPLDLSNPDHPKPGKPEPFLTTAFNESVGVFSPDGRWVAYRSDESGTNEIYVRPFPGPGAKWQISTGGGRYAVWGKGNRELLYLTLDDQIMVLDYTTNGQSFVPGRPRTWFAKPIFEKGFDLDLAPDGTRFAVLAIADTKPADPGSAHVTFLLNFFDELRRRVPVSGK